MKCFRVDNEGSACLVLSIMYFGEEETHYLSRLTVVIALDLVAIIHSRRRLLRSHLCG